MFSLLILIECLNDNFDNHDNDNDIDNVIDNVHNDKLCS